MASRNVFGPSERALEFGTQYAEVLSRWAQFFEAASVLVETNVKLGQMATDSGKEWEKWVQQTAAAPWNWFSPDAMAKFAEAMAGGQGVKSG